MSTFKDQLITDQAVFFNTAELADAGVYSPADGSADVDVVGVLNLAENLTPWEAGGQQAVATFEFKKGATGEPKRYDKITINSVEWSVNAIVAEDIISYTVSLSRDLRLA